MRRNIVSADLTRVGTACPITAHCATRAARAALAAAIVLALTIAAYAAWWARHIACGTVQIITLFACSGSQAAAAEFIGIAYLAARTAIVTIHQHTAKGGHAILVAADAILNRTVR